MYFTVVQPSECSETCGQSVSSYLAIFLKGIFGRTLELFRWTQ